MTFVHGKHVKHGDDSGSQQQPFILLVIILADIGVLDDIRYLILKPVSADANNMPIILHISFTKPYILCHSHILVSGYLSSQEV